jgi:autotransporter family porin
MRISRFPGNVIILKLRYPLISAAIKTLVIGVPFLLGLTPWQRTGATTINSSTSTVVLQTLDPTTAIFVAPATTTIATATFADGISGDSSKDWQLTNHGSITTNGSFANATIWLNSATINALRVENFGRIADSMQAPTILLSNGGTIINHSGASISAAGYYVILSSGAGATITVVNDGDISGLSAIRLAAGGSVTQSATGTISSIENAAIINDNGR